MLDSYLIEALHAKSLIISSQLTQADIPGRPDNTITGGSVTAGQWQEIVLGIGHAAGGWNSLWIM